MPSVQSSAPKVVRAPDGYFHDGEYWYDEIAAQRAVDFFHLFLKHTKGEWAGKPFILSHWQERDIIRPLFGWKDRNGLRRYTRCDIWVPRKNGKSTLGAGIAGHMLFADGEPGAEIYGVANEEDQAGIVFRELARMIEASPDLSEMSSVFSKSIVVPETMSSYQVLTSKAESKDGLNIHGLIWDELHEAKSQDLFDKLTTASGARRQPLFVFITTAGYDRESIGYREYKAAKEILKGKRSNPNRLVVIYEADDKDDWHSPETWKKANPGLGVTVKEKFLFEAHRDALTDPAKEAAFKRYHLNLWTSQATTWMDMDAWDKCAGSVAVEPGERCWVGLDLSKRSDITAAVALFRSGEKGAERYRIVPHFFVPRDGVDRKEKRDGVPYSEWAAAGLITLTPGNTIDFRHIFKHIEELGKRHEIVEIAYDPWGASKLAPELMEAGFNVVEFPQTMKHISFPTKELRNLTLDGRIAHGGNPVLRWMAENAEVITDTKENQMVSKKASTRRVDGIVATIMALGRAIVDEDHESVYERQGLTVI
jgi:phage terminase large subunit-like protein